MGIISQAEREYISHGMSSGHRNDGRSPHQFRPLELDTGVLQQSSGSARCQIGSTSVLVSVRADVGVPSPETPDHGILDCAVAISPCAFKGTAADNLGQELGKIIQKSLKWQEAGLGCAIDLTALSIVPGKRCWSLLVDGLVVSADGNLLDALSIATKAALADLRIPRMEVTMGEDGEEPDLELDDDPELAASLDTTRVPLILTISQGGSASVVDLTEEEEEACSSSAIHVAVTAQGNVCGIHKPGAAAIQPGRLMEMIGVGQTVGSQLHKAVASELYRLEQQQGAP